MYMDNNKITFNARVTYFIAGFLLLAIGLSTPIIYLEIIILLISIIFLTNSFVGISIVENVIVSFKNRSTVSENFEKNTVVGSSKVKKNVSTRKKNNTAISKKKNTSNVKPKVPVKRTSKKK